MKRSIRVPVAFGIVGALTTVLWLLPDGPAEDTLPASAEWPSSGFPETVPLRVLAKQLLAREAAEGRRSLLEAAALYGALNRIPPETAPVAPELQSLFAPKLSAPLPGDTEEERLCQQVIAHLNAVLSDQPLSERQAAVDRLEAQFREELRRHGGIRLPDPSSLTPVEQLFEQIRKGLTPAERQAMFSARQDAAGVEWRPPGSP